jgi:hypothetical protein
MPRGDDEQGIGRAGLGDQRLLAGMGARGDHDLAAADQAAKALQLRGVTGQRLADQLEVQLRSHRRAQAPQALSGRGVLRELWNAIVGNGGQESACGWCKDKWGVNWQITPRALIDAICDPDRAAAKRAFEAMMTMRKIDIAAIEATRRG